MIHESNMHLLTQLASLIMEWDMEWLLDCRKYLFCFSFFLLFTVICEFTDLTVFQYFDSSDVYKCISKVSESDDYFAVTRSDTWTL